MSKNKAGVVPRTGLRVGCKAESQALAGHVPSSLWALATKNIQFYLTNLFPRPTDISIFCSFNQLQLPRKRTAQMLLGGHAPPML